MLHLYPLLTCFLCVGFIFRQTLPLDRNRASYNSKLHGILMPSVSRQTFSLALRVATILKKGLIGLLGFCT